jgi:hypothetical protein
MKNNEESDTPCFFILFLFDRFILFSGFIGPKIFFTKTSEGVKESN